VYWITNKLLNKDKKQLAFAPSSLILTNYFLPVNRALRLKNNSVYQISGRNQGWQIHYLSQIRPLQGHTGGQKNGSFDQNRNSTA
jgi:hypothetical protein